jgi:hypothetical protein
MNAPQRTLVDLDLVFPILVLSGLDGPDPDVETFESLDKLDRLPKGEFHAGHYQNTTIIDCAGHMVRAEAVARESLGLWQRLTLPLASGIPVDFVLLTQPRKLNASELTDLVLDATTRCDADAFRCTRHLLMHEITAASVIEAVRVDEWKPWG